MLKFKAGWFKLLLTDILIWLIAMTSFVFFRFYGLEETNLYSLNQEGMDFDVLLSLGIRGGLLFGFLYGLLDLLLNSGWLKNRSFGSIILVNAVFHVILVLIVNVVIKNMALRLFDLEVDPSAKHFDENFFVVLIFTGVVNVGINFLRGINQRMGKGNLWRFLTGKFHSPRVEERVFMFLDLKSSTTIAEKIGHIKFSELLQECFNDLSVVEKYKAEVYQYVGDEAVLTWPVLVGLENDNCLKTYYSFAEVLKSKENQFIEKYTIAPFFKAGLHLGKVTITEVGQLKREIAFHGDTMNTTARIQEMCNQLHEGLLMSEALSKRLPFSNEYKPKEVGKILLKGKSEEIVLFGVSDS